MPVDVAPQPGGGPIAMGADPGFGRAAGAMQQAAQGGIQRNATQAGILQTGVQASAAMNQQLMSDTQKSFQGIADNINKMAMQSVDRAFTEKMQKEKMKHQQEMEKERMKHEEGLQVGERDDRMDAERLRGRISSDAAEQQHKFAVARQETNNTQSKEALTEQRAYEEKKQRRTIQTVELVTAMRRIHELMESPDLGDEGRARAIEKLSMLRDRLHEGRFEGLVDDLSVLATFEAFQRGQIIDNAKNRKELVLQGAEARASMEKAKEAVLNRFNDNLKVNRNGKVPEHLSSLLAGGYTQYKDAPVEGRGAITNEITKALFTNIRTPGGVADLYALLLTAPPEEWEGLVARSETDPIAFKAGVDTVTQLARESIRQFIRENPEAKEYATTILHEIEGVGAYLEGTEHYKQLVLGEYRVELGEFLTSQGRVPTPREELEILLGLTLLPDYVPSKLEFTGVSNISRVQQRDVPLMPGQTGPPVPRDLTTRQPRDSRTPTGAGPNFGGGHSGRHAKVVYRQLGPKLEKLRSSGMITDAMYQKILNELNSGTAGGVTKAGEQIRNMEAMSRRY